jgi:hypothetical protein
VILACHHPGKAIPSPFATLSTSPISSALKTFGVNGRMEIQREMDPHEIAADGRASMDTTGKGPNSRSKPLCPIIQGMIEALSLRHLMQTTSAMEPSMLFVHEGLLGPLIDWASVPAELWLLDSLAEPVRPSIGNLASASPKGTPIYGCSSSLMRRFRRGMTARLFLKHLYR